MILAGNRREELLSRAVFVTAGLAPAVLAALSPRTDWPVGTLAVLMGVDDQAGWEAISSVTNRTLNFILLALATTLLIIRLPQQRLAVIPLGILLMLLAALTMALGLVANPGSSVPSGAVLWPVLLGTMCLLSETVLPRLIADARLIGLFYIYGSLISVALIPGWAAQPDYTIGVIPGLTIRLFGITSHPNNLGFVAFFTFLIVIYGRRTPWFLGHILAILSVIVLAQSKSFFLLVPLTFAVWLVYRWLADRPTGGLLAAVLPVAVFILVAAGYVIAFTAGAEEVGREEGLATLMARIDLWQITLDEWQLRPLLGYGPNLWDLDMAQRYEAQLGFLVGGHSHNQIVQVLGQSGVIGLFWFGLFLVWFLYRSATLAVATGGASLVLGVVIVVRGTIEPFFYPQIIDLTAYVFLIALLMASGRYANRPTAT